MVKRVLCGFLAAVFLAPTLVVAADYVDIKEETLEYSKC